MPEWINGSDCKPDVESSILSCVSNGEVSEWFKVQPWKGCGSVRVPQVRILSSPQMKINELKKKLKIARRKIKCQDLSLEERDKAIKFLKKLEDLIKLLS